MPKRKLKIAQIAPIIERVPPKNYGGTERVVSTLTEELVRLGHDVTLFATGDSKTTAKLDAIYPKSIRESKISRSEALEWSMLHIGRVYDRQEEFDIIHDHNSSLGTPLANLAKVPTIITLHGAVKSGMAKMLKTYKNPYYVSISKDQVKDAEIKRLTTIPNGEKLETNIFSEKSKDYLLFVGRISEIKGTHVAVEIAEELGLPLIIAAKLDDADKKYFETKIKPRLNDQIRWIGEVDSEKRNKLMSEAICLVNPISWREPFGLIMIEAMSCGCPVVSFNKGSVPEVMQDGKTGFNVNNKKEMIEAIKKINQINRSYCRDYALSNFNEKIMAQRYVELYQKAIQESDTRTQLPTLEDIFKSWDNQVSEFQYQSRLYAYPKNKN